MKTTFLVVLAAFFIIKYNCEPPKTYFCNSMNCVERVINSNGLKPLVYRIDFKKKNMPGKPTKVELVRKLGVKGE